MIDTRAIVEWFTAGGWTMAALTAVALALAYLVIERLLDIRGEARALRGRGRAPLPAPAVADEAAAEAGVRGLRRIGLIRACVVVAPLLGLLGTVTGIIDTFDSILAGGYIAEMGEGIRKALLTTQYGLAIAAPGLVAERLLVRRQERLRRLRRAAGLAAEGEA
ncbi:MAG: MotA/TolQ/ExbB proton channel family protein [Phycisphaerae bacterium]